MTRFDAVHHEDLDMSPERLSIVPTRALLVGGDRDGTFPVEFALGIYRALPNASLWVVPGHGHGTAMREIRDVFAGTVLRFLSEGWPG